MGRSTNPLVKINATENIQERIRAVAYFGKLTTEAAMYRCEKQKYRPIEVYPINITVAVYEARERYFKNSIKHLKIYQNGRRKQIEHL